LYAADTAVLSIARQVGKTYDVGAVAFALCIAISGLTVVWTAHRFKVSRESFNEMRAWAKRRQLAPHIEYDDITTAAGNECIPFRNDSRIVFAARERGSIRGFTKVGLLVLDEAQILTEAALSDLVPTTNQAANPLVILMGTPPKPTDPGEVFIRLRQEALDGESDDVLYVELSADGDADPNDRGQWSKANPSYPTRTSERAILRLKKLLSAEDFLREGLGIWPPESGSRIIPSELWAGPLAAAGAERPAQVAFALHVNPDRTRAAVAYAGRRPDGLMQVGLVDWRAGTSWVVDRLVELRKRWSPAAVAVDTRSEGLLLDLEKAGIAVPEDPDEPEPGDLVIPTAADTAAAYAMFVDTARAERLRHADDAPVNTALAGARTRPLAGGATWDHRGPGESGPLKAVTLAAWAFEARAHLVQADYDPLANIY
jgi:hypothetical protein